MQGTQVLQFSHGPFHCHHRLPLPIHAALKFSPFSMHAISLFRALFSGTCVSPVSIFNKSLPICIGPAQTVLLLPFQDSYRQVISPSFPQHFLLLIINSTFQNLPFFLLFF